MRASLVEGDEGGGAIECSRECGEGEARTNGVGSGSGGGGGGGGRESAGGILTERLGELS